MKGKASMKQTLLALLICALLLGGCGAPAAPTQIGRAHV